MKKPLVAIVGRPNVGKSTFFNKICGRRISIVEDTPGVTRDRIYGDAEWCGYNFSLVDTGGLDFNYEDEMQQNIYNQAKIAIDLADVIMFFVDGKEGITNNDKEVASLLRKSRKPIVLVVNKLDNNEIEKTYEFYELNIGEPMLLSAEQGKGIGDILDEVVKHFNKIEVDPNADAIKIAIVGRPNAGKSSITNKILGEERVVVSNVAGTTRDAIDTPFRYNGQDYILIDTAGMRKKKNIESESIERYSILRSLEAIKRADIVLIVIDSQDFVTEQDVKIAGIVHEENKPSIIVMNKWDTIEKNDRTINKYIKKLDEDLAFMSYYKSIFVSAKTGQRLSNIMPTVEEVLENANRRVTTGVLNDIISDAVSVNQPPMIRGKKLKLYYATQVGVKPPTIVLFVNDASAMHFSYERYLENSIRKAIDFSGTPIKLVIKQKAEDQLE